MNRDPYRDAEGVLRCRHHQKLHVACHECEEHAQEQQEAYDRKWDNMRHIAFVAIALGAFGIVMSLAVFVRMFI